MTPSRLSPFGPGHRPVWTEEGGQAGPTPDPHIPTAPGIYGLALDLWIGTLRIQVGTGDIVKQHTQAIVNPANSHLNHFGGAARAIADAAGIDLVGECEAYKQTHGLLPTAAVMHTTACKLRPHIATGPRDVDYGDKEELQTILTRTYHSVIKYASETLRIPTVCIPPISSGIFHVLLSSVVRAFYTAVNQYVDGYARTSHTRILQSIQFISNRVATTAVAASLFQELYDVDHPAHTPTPTPSDPPAPMPSGRQAG